EVEKTLHHNLSGESAGESRILSGSKQRHREENTGHTDAEQRAQQSVSVLNLRHISVPRPVEGGGREYQDCPVYEQSEHERNTRIDRGELDRFAFAFERLLELASLHNGRVQVKVMRHHG